MKNLLNPDNKFHFLLLFVAGALLTLAFQPINFVALALVSFAILLLSWSRSTPRQALINGWLFSMGLQCSGISWIFFSLYYHGGAPAAMAVLMIVLLSAYLSIYPAIAGWLVNRYTPQQPVLRLLLLYPLMWGLCEWMQGIVMTGFAWMQPGYTLIDTPLAGYSPLIGNHGLGVILLVLSGVIVAAITALHSRVQLAGIAAVIVGLGLVLQQFEWTDKQDDAIKVSLVQGNVPQHLKWKREMHVPTLQRYRELSLQQSDSDLIIWPETAVPGYQHRLMNYLAMLDSHIRKQDADLLLGIFIKDQQTERYYNSLLNVNGEHYKKRHLVPLGEYIPLRFLITFFNRWIDIPMSDIAHGSMEQPLLTAAGQPLGVSICFEDAFARDVIRDLPEATLLVNVSNDAWFDGSHEPMQHHAIARMRALETGRTMLRVTNTGLTAVIKPDGSVQAQLPRHEIAVLNEEVYAYAGATPYVIWGDGLLIVIAILVMSVVIYRGSKKAN